MTAERPPPTTVVINWVRALARPAVTHETSVAPKNEAAHATTGVSSQPKNRAMKRPIFISMATGPERAHQDEEDQCRQDRDRKGPESKRRARKFEGRGRDHHDDGQHDRAADQRCRIRRSRFGRLICQDPGTHPRQEGSGHPPNRR